MTFSDLLADLDGLARAADDTWISLPPAAYCSQELFELEAEHLFRCGWILVGRVDQVAKPGDYLCFDVVDEPIVVTRDKLGKLHVLSRVCRHRWMEVCQGRGNANAFVCPYHAWTYELDGRLRHAPEMHNTPRFDPGSVRLPQIRAEIWQGFIFVNITGDAEPLNETLSLASAELHGYDLPNWVTVRSVDFGDSPWDWKVFMDNGEIYHHLMLHRDTVEPRSPAHLGVSGPRADGFFLLYGPAAPEVLVEASDGKPAMPSYLKLVGDWAPSNLTDIQRTSAAYFYPYPNYVIALWVNVGIFFRVIPLQAGRCHILADYIVPGELADHPDLEEALEEAVQGFGVVHEQDSFACEGVQRGVRSRFATQGPLSYLEEHNHAFARWFARKITAAAGSDGMPFAT